MRRTRGPGLEGKCCNTRCTSENYGIRFGLTCMNAPITGGNKKRRRRPWPPGEEAPNQSCADQISAGVLHPSGAALFQICRPPGIFLLQSFFFSSSGDRSGHVSFSVPLGCRLQRRCHGMFRQNFRGLFIWRFPAVALPYRCRIFRIR